MIIIIIISKDLEKIFKIKIGERRRSFEDILASFSSPKRAERFNVQVDPVELIYTIRSVKTCCGIHNWNVYRCR